MKNQYTSHILEDSNSETVPQNFKEKLQDVVSGKYKSKKVAQDYNFWEFYNRTGHDLGSMLVECSYRGTDCNQARDWKTIFTRYGKCYTFNNPNFYSYWS